MTEPTPPFIAELYDGFGLVTQMRVNEPVDELRVPAPAPRPTLVESSTEWDQMIAPMGPLTHTYVLTVRDGYRLEYWKKTR